MCSILFGRRRAVHYRNPNRTIILADRNELPRTGVGWMHETVIIIIVIITRKKEREKEREFRRISRGPERSRGSGNDRKIDLCARGRVCGYEQKPNRHVWRARVYIFTISYTYTKLELIAREISYNNNNNNSTSVRTTV